MPRGRMEELVTLRLPERLLRDLDRKAEELGLKRSKLLRRILEAYLHGEDKITIKKVYPNLDQAWARFKELKTWDDRLQLIDQLAAEALALAHAYKEAGNLEATHLFLKLVLGYQQEAIKVMRDRDFDEIRQRLDRLTQPL